MNHIVLPELKKLIFKNVDCKNKVEHLILENDTVDFTWVESNRSYDVIQVQSINILITSNKNFEILLRTRVNILIYLLLSY